MSGVGGGAGEGGLAPGLAGQAAAWQKVGKRTQVLTLFVWLLGGRGGAGSLSACVGGKLRSVPFLEPWHVSSMEQNELQGTKAAVSKQERHAD